MFPDGVLRVDFVTGKGAVSYIKNRRSPFGEYRFINRN
jgi:hypothetical protein